MTEPDKRHDTFHCLCLVLAITVSVFSSVNSGHVCQKSYKDRYSTSCGFLGWSRCTRYRTKYKSVCCSGWKDPANGLSCNSAICAGKINPNACSISYNVYITYRNGLVQQNSGGTCSAPDVCKDCNDGFYPDGSQCTICPTITNCNYAACTYRGDSTCQYCVGEVKDEVGYRAYTRHKDGGLSCQQTCSWRSLCYPGTCPDELVSSCQCHTGFSGDHCLTIHVDPSITYNQAKLKEGANTATVPDDPNDLANDLFKWTNNPSFNEIDCTFTSTYMAEGILPEYPLYILSFHHGIIAGHFELYLMRNDQQIGNTLRYDCPSISESSPVTALTCSATLDLATLQLPFHHDDTIYFEVNTVNGGHVEYKDMESNVIHVKSLVGRSTSYTYMFRFDLETPTHCVISNCNRDPLTAPDITADNQLTFSWDGWSDELSGLHKFQYELYLLKTFSDKLTEGSSVAGPTDLSIHTASISVAVNVSGVYSMIFSAFDTAGNYKSTRRIIMFDDESKVSKQAIAVLRMVTASVTTNYRFLTTETNQLKIKWLNRFINIQHHTNKWLNAVKAHHGISSEYDDNRGDRTTSAIDNVNGIVKFKVAYAVAGVAPGSSQDFTPVANLHDQSIFLSVNMEDGDQITIMVQAYDVLNEYDEDQMIVTKDVSPPVIKNLWLTRGDMLNISVHNFEELTAMMIEWEAYDYHTGLDSVQWRIYDNYSDIEHGQEYVSPQGESQSESDCHMKYDNYPRGANCYCTLFHGCHHKHFQVKPRLIDSQIPGGLHVGKERGVHDRDYYIQISVTNKALLTSSLQYKVSIDVTPPHQGVVHDGIFGSGEVDFQQSRSLSAYWDGFFDRESGVLFYRYGFSEECLDIDAFDINSPSELVTKTYSTHATYEAPSDGMYHVTVVAYNRALDASTPVCSDGVTIDKSGPGVKEVVIKNLRMGGGLVKDNVEVWLLQKNGFLRLVHNPSDSCRNKARVLNNVFMYPVDVNKDGSQVTVEGSSVCDTARPALVPVLGILPKSTQLEISWVGVEGKSGIHDYQIGLSTTSDSAYPDRLQFTSTKQHTHFRLSHPDIPQGSKFYVVIKAISKAGVEAVKSVGPMIVDGTHPEFVGEITVEYSDGVLVAKWPITAVSDNDHGPYPLLYTFALGHSKKSSEVFTYRPLLEGGDCTMTSPPSCTAVSTSDLPWRLHGHHVYYVSVKVENMVGLSTIVSSSPYIHDVQPPSHGLVVDIDTEANTDHAMFMGLPVEADDIDFQSARSKLGARWSAFRHPHLEVQYSVGIGTEPNSINIQGYEDVATMSHVFEGLNLQAYQKYYFTVMATTAAGSVVTSSDGVTIIVDGDVLEGIQIKDGYPCSSSDIEIADFSHHSEERRLACLPDIDYQTALNVIQGYWTADKNKNLTTTGVSWAIEEKEVHADYWNTFSDFEHTSPSQHVIKGGLFLQAGRTYRIAVKFCGERHCFQSLFSNGVTITPSPPRVGDMITKYNDTHPDSVEIVATFEKFRDPDIENKEQAESVMAWYEWTLTDNSNKGKLLRPWQILQSINSEDANYDKVTVTLEKKLDFSKCVRLLIRGYTHAGLSATVSADVRQCVGIEIKPRTVLDAASENGQEVYLARNEAWPKPDIEYTAYSNILSAVWPSLRHHHYVWAVLEDIRVNPITYYQQEDELQLNEPCTHPQAIKCGYTDEEDVNVKFDDGELKHGKRYMICIHADRVKLEHESWTDLLPEVSACSDGVVIDLTDPTPGSVWIGMEKRTLYQTSLTDITVNWNSFLDIEEESSILHSSGIRTYYVAIGTSPGSFDVQTYTDVGVTNHVTFHGLLLQNGHTYYASVTGKDFVDREVTTTSVGIIVDDTPPIMSDQSITTEGRYITTMQGVSACWEGVFEDTDSGIEKFSWSVGSQPGYSDIMQYTDTQDICAISDPDKHLDMQEGHTYFINVGASNNAGLSSLATSWAFGVDITPPIAGHVYDGKIENLSPGQLDADFQTDMTSLFGRWKGFHDAHSEIKEYFVSIGTCPQCEDVLVDQPIGIRQDVHVNHLLLSAGLTYYITVTCCNTADLCTTVTSDGVTIDKSPPSPGHVQDGTEATDIQYQAMSDILGAKWYGFSDPQTSVLKYVVRVGTSPGADDIMIAIDVHLTEEAYWPQLSSNMLLPEGRAIYTTVRAYNPGGLYSEATSNGFIVDSTAPVIMTAPSLSRGAGSMVEHSLIYRTSIKVEWVVQDDESSIQRQFLSIASHHGGDFSLESTAVGGAVRDYIFTNLTLHDGSTYYVKLIVCNSAKLCTESVSDGIFVDSTPPTPGMFAIDTDHAAKLQRQIEGWMTWTETLLSLSVIGFADLHSSIDHYAVTVGSTFMNSDLNKKTTSAEILPQADSGYNQDEGEIQLLAVNTKSISQYDYVYVSVWAFNKVGLNSAAIHNQFRLIPGGSLSLTRRCSAFSCSGHCVCAAQDKTCPSELSCIQVTDEDTLVVTDVVDLSFPVDLEDIDYIPTDNVMAAKWTSNKDIIPMWYEWSIGHSDEAEPEGVFNQATERVWFNIGQRSNIAISLPRDKHLLTRVKYSFFIRAWYDQRSFGVYKSNGVSVVLTPPIVTSIRGASVKELLGYSFKTDVDFIKHDLPLYVSWKDKFVDAAIKVEKFRIYLSTYPCGHDVFVLEQKIPGTQFGYNFSDMVELGLRPGVLYYTNVVAYNYGGIHLCESSDGFMIDSDNPVRGIVYDGIGQHDLEYQNTSRIPSSSWHGFTDLTSGVAHYTWCVGYTQDTEECGVIPWRRVGLHTDISVVLPDTPLASGVSIYNKVFATDTVGYNSSTVISDGVTVDVTPPEPASVLYDTPNLLLNPSFEDTRTEPVDLNNPQVENLCSFDISTDWFLSDNGCIVAVTSGQTMAYDGKVFILLYGDITQTVTITPGLSYRVRFYTTHLPVKSSVLASKEGFVQFGDNKHIFLIYQKSYRSDADMEDVRKSLRWHQHTYYFVAKENEVDFTLGSVDTGTGIAIDGVSITQRQAPRPGDDANIDLHMVSLHGWTSVHAAWQYLDLESPITGYSCAIGYTEGGTQLQGFESVGLRTFAQSSDVTLTHNSYIHVTIIATNAAALRHVVHSEPMLIDLTPPIFTFIHDGLSKVSDAAFQHTYVISVTWAADDEESGLNYCDWAIGHSEVTFNIQLFIKIDGDAQTASRELDADLVDNKMIFVSVRCHNKAGLYSMAVTDGVRVVIERPNTDAAELQVLPLSVTQYPATDGYQSDVTKLRLKWTGFQYLAGIDSYQVAIIGPDLHLSRRVLAYTQINNFLTVSDLQLSPGHYNISIAAFNPLQMESDVIQADLIILSDKPIIDNNFIIEYTWNKPQTILTLIWKDLFVSVSSLYYEVSVGSTSGAADVIQWQETKETRAEFVIPPPRYSPNLLIHVTVHAINPSGLFNTVTGQAFVTF